MKNLTLKKLNSLDPCEAGRMWFINQKEKDIEKICLNLVNESHPEWASWLLARLLNKKLRVKWAIYAAEQVLDIFEKKYPDDKRPREAIRAVKCYLKSPSKKNQDAAANAAYAVNAAAYAAANAVAYAATYAAYATTYAVNAAANAANAAYAANAADAAAKAAVRKEMQIKLVKKACRILRSAKK